MASVGFFTPVDNENWEYRPMPRPVLTQDVLRFGRLLIGSPLGCVAHAVALLVIELPANLFAKSLFTGKRRFSYGARLGHTLKVLAQRICGVVPLLGAILLQKAWPRVLTPAYI